LGAGRTSLLDAIRASVARRAWHTFTIGVVIRPLAIGTVLAIVATSVLLAHVVHADVVATVAALVVVPLAAVLQVDAVLTTRIVGLPRAERMIAEVTAVGPLPNPVALVDLVVEADPAIGVAADVVADILVVAVVVDGDEVGAEGLASRLSVVPGQGSCARVLGVAAALVLGPAIGAATHSLAVFAGHKGGAAITDSVRGAFLAEAVAFHVPFTVGHAAHRLCATIADRARRADFAFVIGSRIDGMGRAVELAEVVVAVGAVGFSFVQSVVTVVLGDNVLTQGAVMKEVNKLLLESVRR
jgi:hypothetical protein